MKKLLSIIVCLAMIMTMAAGAFAAADTELAPGASSSANETAGDRKSVV